MVTVLPMTMAPAARKRWTMVASAARPAPGVEHRAVLRRHIGGVDDVLDTDGKSMKRAERASGAAIVVDAFGGGAREGRVEKGKCADLRLAGGNPLQQRLGQLDGAQGPACQSLPRGERRQVGQIGFRHARVHLP